MLNFDNSFQMIEEETLEQKHSCEVKTDWSDDAHKCDREGDSEVKGALVDTLHQKGTQVRFGIPEEIQTEY